MLLTSLAFLSLSLSAPQPQSVSDFFALPPAGRGRRAPIVTDQVLHQVIHNHLKTPGEGVAVQLLNGDVLNWKKVQANQDGWVQDSAFRGGWAATIVSADSDKVMLMTAAGQSMSLVNGEPYGGDVYGYGWLHTPVQLKKGDNLLMFKVARGRLKVSLAEPAAPLQISAQDLTLPDAVAGESSELWGAAVVINSSQEPQTVTLSADLGEGKNTSSPSVIPPLSSRKLAFPIPRPTLAESGSTKGSLKLSTGASIDLNIRTRTARQMHKRTFFSKIDNSLQYFAVQPSSQDHEAGESALFLSVHGASVEATNQAGAYGSKSWGTLAAATNRRPYGFDWEDWGQQDALEVLAEAKRIYQPDEQRIYLTGHSMGGHGTWYLGSMHPDQWAAIAPCAGWVHFGLYGGGGVDASDDPIETLLARAYNVSNPLKVIRNYKQHGVYVLHGDADRTVPISLARDMREKLGEFHKDLDFHEEPGGGHWYDMTDDPGADCVDYPPLFQFFARHRRTMPAEAKNVEFWTCSPSVASQNQWVEVQQQGIAGAPSMVNLEQSAPLSRVKGESKNVTLMTFTLNHFDKSRSLKLVLDGQTIEDLPIGADGKVTVRKTGAGWVADQAKPSDKYPARNGWFKKAFDNNFVFVYATGGTDEENAWSYAKARFDSQAWWYRGNGDVEIIADRDFRLADYRDQSVIVYGNSDTVTCWGALLKDSPVQIDRKGVHLPTDRIGGDDLAVLMVRPRPDSDTAQVGVVSGSGVKGQKLTMAFNYFLAGVHFPDLFVADSSMLTEGSSGVRMAGWFANDWSMNGADMVRR